MGESPTEDTKGTLGENATNQWGRQMHGLLLHERGIPRIEIGTGEEISSDGFFWL